MFIGIVNGVLGNIVALIVDAFKLLLNSRISLGSGAFLAICWSRLLKFICRISLSAK